MREGIMKTRRQGIMRHFTRFSRSESASILTMSALMMPVIIGMAGLGLDASSWLMTQRMLQNSVDAAVLASAWEIAHGLPDNAQTAGEHEAENNGYDPAKSGTLTLDVSTDDSGQAVVTATLRQKADVFLSKVIHHDDIYIATTAAATLIGPTGDFCVLALNNAASGAITFWGNADVNSSGCGLAMNSNSSTALDIGGSAAADVSDVSIVGGSDAACGSNGLTCTSMKTNSGSTPDPYANLAIPAHPTACTNEPDPSNLVPGTICGGLAIHNGTVNLAPGIYYIQDGDLAMNGGTITGNGVTIIMTSSDGTTYGNMTLRGNATLNLTAPTTGPTAGVAIFVDRNAPTAEAGSGNACQNKMNGNGTLNITGTIYVPSQCLVFSGNNSTSSSTACTRIIADSVVFQGSSGIGNNCSGTEVKNIGQYTVKLTM
jgi:Flp pilus assembly protein TadG